MKTDKSSSKGSTTKILLWVVIVSVALLVLLIVALIAIPKLQNNPSKLPPELQGSASETIKEADMVAMEEAEESESETYDGSVISVESVTIPKGSDEVTLNIRVFNNPGIMGAILKISVDDQIFAFKSGTQIGFPGLTLTAPGPSSASSPYIFMMDAMELSDSDRCDGTIFAVTFKVKDTSVTGEFEVRLSYEEGGFFDEDYRDLDVALENGTITIE